MLRQDTKANEQLDDEAEAEAEAEEDDCNNNDGLKFKDDILESLIGS